MSNNRFFNGKALEHGSRFKMTSDFGFVTLDLTNVYDRDSGIYTCKASNKGDYSTLCHLRFHVHCLRDDKISNL